MILNILCIPLCASICAGFDCITAESQILTILIHDRQSNQRNASFLTSFLNRSHGIIRNTSYTNDITSELAERFYIGKQLGRILVSIGHRILPTLLLTNRNNIFGENLRCKVKRTKSQAYKEFFIFAFISDFDIACIFFGLRGCFRSGRGGLGCVGGCTACCKTHKHHQCQDDCDYLFHSWLLSNIDNITVIRIY